MMKRCGFVFMLALLFLPLLSACGAAKEASPTETVEQPAEPVRLTETEYLDMVVNGIFSEVLYSLGDMAIIAREQEKEPSEELYVLFKTHKIIIILMLDEFSNITPPEKYEEVHEDYRRMMEAVKEAVFLLDESVEGRGSRSQAQDELEKVLDLAKIANERLGEMEDNPALFSL